MLIRLQGIVMRAREYGESNKIVTIFSESHGKISFVARGAKKPRSRYGAVTEPFTMALFVCFQSSAKSMPTLSSADLLESNYALRSDLLLTSVGAYWMELANKLLEEREPDPFLYHLFIESFAKLQEKKDADILTRIIELAFLRKAGYQPVFDHCVDCGREEQLRHVSVIRGGMLCTSHHSRDPRAIRISPQTGKLLPLIQILTPQRLGKVQIHPETRSEIEKVIQAFYDEYVEVHFTTKEIWQNMKRTFEEET